MVSTGAASTWAGGWALGISIIIRDVVLFKDQTRPKALNGREATLYWGLNRCHRRADAT
jgi:hypothetical protein